MSTALRHRRVTGILYNIGRIAGLFVCFLTLFMFISPTARAFVLVENGMSAGNICVNEHASSQVMAAVDTLQSYVQQISGAVPPIVHVFDTDAQQIVIEVGTSDDPELNVGDFGDDGFRIKTSKDKLYLTAKTDYGIQNAVYTFLESYLGCRMYSPAVTIIPRQSTIILPEIDDRQVPALTFRMQDIHEPSYAAWHKLNSHEDFGLFVQTFKILVPPEKYFAQHPEYFSLLNGTRTPNGQLCLSHPDVYRIVVKELQKRVQANPRARFWSVSQNDTYVPCACDACRATDSVAGSPSGSILHFVNRIADEFPEKTISTLAYQYSRSAPKNIKPRPNVNIMLCSIECNRSKPLVDDPGSAAFVQDVRDWSALTHNIFLWDYVIQFRNLVSPFPNLHVLQPNIQFFADNGITAVFEQGLPETYGEFAELRIYLIAKLLWNPWINVDSVMNDFLNGFYGDAGPIIRQYIDTMRVALQASGEDLSIYGYPERSVKGYLSPRMMDSYGVIFDRAEDAVREYPEILSRVQTARLPLQYALLEQAKADALGDRGFFVRNDDGTFTIRLGLDSLLTIFVERCKRAGIPRLWEHGISPDEYFASTRSFLDRSARDHLARGKPVWVAQSASPKYLNGDQTALTDGLKGWEDYHIHWLGFEGEDMEATVDLGSVQLISAIDTDFLQDINSWIFMPLAVEFSLSADGIHYHVVDNVENKIPANKNGALTAAFNARFESQMARYVKVKAAGMKTCPAWHKGSGGPAWIFVDEITVK